MTETTLVTFLCPKTLLKDFDEAWKRIGGRYVYRTHALLTSMENFIEANKKETEK